MTQQGSCFVEFASVEEAQAVVAKRGTIKNQDGTDDDMVLEMKYA